MDINSWHPLSFPPFSLPRWISFFLHFRPLGAPPSIDLFNSKSMPFHADSLPPGRQFVKAEEIEKKGGPECRAE